MVGWHHQFNGKEFEQALGDGEGQGNLVYCSHEIKDTCSWEEKFLKSRDITLPTKIRLVKAMVFPVVMYRCESWITEKAEH